MGDGRGRRVKPPSGDVVWRGTGGQAPRPSGLPTVPSPGLPPSRARISAQEGLVTGPGAPRVRGAAEGRGRGVGPVTHPPAKR